MDATLKYLRSTPLKEVEAAIKRSGRPWVTDRQLKAHLIKQGSKKVGVDGIVNMPLGEAVAAMRKSGRPWVK